MTDTPETYEAERESIAAYIEAYGPDAVFPCDGYDHARKLERERDEIRAQLREEQQLHIQTLNERDKARWRADTMFAKYVDILEQTRNECDDLAAALNRACANPTTGNWYREAQDALAAWKEARCES
jgi:hypothetical protein